MFSHFLEAYFIMFAIWVARETIDLLWNVKHHLLIFNVNSTFMFECECKVTAFFQHIS
jgi:hypothetical protein